MEKKIGKHKICEQKNKTKWKQKIHGERPKVLIFSVKYAKIRPASGDVCIVLYLDAESHPVGIGTIKRIKVFFDDSQSFGFIDGFVDCGPFILQVENGDSRLIKRRTNPRFNSAAPETQSRMGQPKIRPPGQKQRKDRDYEEDFQITWHRAHYCSGNEHGNCVSVCGRRIPDHD